MARRGVVVGGVGRMKREQKRVGRWPALVKALESAGIDFRFELLGDGPRQPWLEQQLPSGRTIFHGRKSGDEYASVLRGWDFITSVSDYEGLPISMLEAFSAGVLPLCPAIGDRKSTRLNSSHKPISYAVFCLKKKNKIKQNNII